MADGGRAWRGYFPVGNEFTSGKPDRKEGIYFGAEFRRIILPYWLVSRCMDRICFPKSPDFGRCRAGLSECIDGVQDIPYCLRWPRVWAWMSSISSGAIPMIR